MAYTSRESGPDEVYVQTFPGPGGKWQISTEGGGGPVWSRDGEELFYQNGAKMMVVDVDVGAERGFTGGAPRLLFEKTGAIAELNANFDVTPDGERFVMVESGAEPPPAQLNVVLNWFDELKRLVPTN